jgi:hypothetical protein
MEFGQVMGQVLVELSRQGRYSGGRSTHYYSGAL